MVNKCININPSTYIRAIVVIVLLCMMLPAVAAKIEVTSDRTEIQDNESFTLEFSSDSSVDDDPDFAPIEKDFSIVSRSQSSNIQFIQGRLDRKTTWVLVLMPKTTGNFTIPAIKFGSDRSDPINIKVVKSVDGQSSSSDDLVYVEAFVDTNSAYVQSQILYTLRIFHAVSFRNASLSELSLNDKDAVVEKLEENKKYTKFINGRRYQVFEKRYAIFPQVTGELIIQPSILDVQYIEAMRTLRNKRISSNTIKVDVKPIPKIMSNKKLRYWLPAQEINLVEKWSGDTGELKIGEPLTRTVTLTAKGLLPSALPDLSVNLPVDGLKHYPDQPMLDHKVSEAGFEGQRQEKIAYIPSEAGTVELPELIIYWWDTKKNALQKAVLPSREITVSGEGANKAENESSNSLIDKRDAANMSESDKMSAEGSVTFGDTSQTVSIAGATKSLWFWASVVLLILWIATIVLWLSARGRGDRTGKIDTTHQAGSNFSGDAIKHIKAACDSKDPQTAKQALLQWGKKAWPENPPTSLGHIGERVNSQLSKELESLNTVLYKPGESRWDGRTLWSSLQSFAEEQKKKENIRVSKIKPLFRIAVNQES